MKPVNIRTDKFQFDLDESGYWKMDVVNATCPEESGFSGFIKNQQDRVDLARFLHSVSVKLATPKEK